MKKRIIFLVLVSLFCSLSLQASPVSQDRALKIAKTIFSAQPSTKVGSGDIELIWDGDEIATKSSLPPAFYVFARAGGGFVIIAGDDNVRPVLGISPDGRFETQNMPDNVKWWMDRMKAYVRSTLTQSPEVKELWTRFVGTKTDASISGEVSDKVERLTPEWDQGNNDGHLFGSNIFNAFCPTVGGALTVTGCVPVALGELLTYESGQSGVNVPGNASGSVGGYTVPDGFVAPAEYSLGATYDWESLRTLTDYQRIRTASTAVKNNLGRLLADLGAIVEAQYSVGGTGTVNETIIGHMIDHFGLNKAARLERSSDYNPRQWESLLRSELDQRPVLFSGFSPDKSSGHTFLLDAYGTYDGATVFHVNFGWHGSNNGYYYCTNLSSSNGDYSYHTQAFIDFYPDPDSEYPVRLEAYYKNDEYPGIRLQKNSSGYMVYYCIINEGNNDYNGRVRFVLHKKDGTSSVIDTREFSLASGYYGSRGFGYVSIPQVSFGDRVAYYYEDGSNWEVLKASVHGTVIDEWPLMPAAFIATEDSYSVGDYFEFRLKNNDYRYTGTIWTIIDPDGESTACPQSDRDFQLTKAGCYKIEAAVAPTLGAAVTETIVTYITVE